MLYLKKIANPNAIIALLIGILLIVMSYNVKDQHGFFHSLTHEIGFAFLVSVIIWMTFEVFTSTQTETEWENRIENITKSVFFGVLRKNLPERYMKEVNSLILDSGFIRSGLRITYTLHDKKYTDRDGAERRYVRVETTAFYKLKNITNEVQKVKMSMGLPNPLINEMKEITKVTSIRLTKGDKTTMMDLSKAERQFREDIKDDNKHTVPFKLDDVDCGPDQEVEIVFCYDYAKEEEDNEVYQTLYPADGITVEIIDRGSTPRAILCKVIGPHEIERVSGGATSGASSYRLSRYLLPRQGVIVWWKKLPPDPPPRSAETASQEAQEAQEAEGPQGAGEAQEAPSVPVATG